MLEKIVSEMPKVSINSVSEDDQVEFGIYPHAVEIIVEAQCKLLAKRGWRKVPSEEELKEQLVNSSQFLTCQATVNILAEELHRWLLEV